MRYTQPQTGPTKLDPTNLDVAKFTHVFSWGLGGTTPANSVTGQSALTQQGSITAGIAQAGRGAVFSGVADTGFLIAGNPLATSTCTYLWVDNGNAQAASGGVIAQSLYGAAGGTNNGGLQIRLSGADVSIIRTNQAGDLTATGIRTLGRTNVIAVSVAGNTGRIAVFSNGRLMAAGTASTYTHGTSFIGDQGSFGGNVPFSGTLSLWMFAPAALSDATLARLTANPWQIFKSSTLLLPPAAVQLLSPTSDLSAGTWTPSGGPSLFAMLNEAVASDATFDVTSQASTFSVGLAAGVNPGVTTGHVVRYRIVGSQTVSLMQGAAVIASWSQAPTVMTTFAQTLSGVQAASITNYATLSLQFQAT